MFKLLLSISLLILSSTNVFALSFNGSPEKKIMCIGDSITWKSGSTDSFSYRKYLQDLLGVAKYQFVGSKTTPSESTTNYVFHEGIGGDNVEDVNARIDAALDSYMPATNNTQSKVILYVGINDMNASEDEATNVAVIADSPLTNSSILGKIVAHDPNIEIFVGLIQPSTTGSLNTRLDTFNTLLKARLDSVRSTNGKVHYFDMNAAMENTSNCSTVSACMSDSLHPNDTGYAVFGTVVYNCLADQNARYCDGH